METLFIHINLRMKRKNPDEKLDELALMIGRGFNELRDNMNAKFASVEQQLGGIEQRLDRVEFLVNGQDNRISVLEDRPSQTIRVRKSSNPAIPRPQRRINPPMQSTNESGGERSNHA